MVAFRIIHIRLIQLIFLIASLFLSEIVHAQNNENLPGCYAKLENELLIIGNNDIERIWLWNNGNIITQSITDKKNNKKWIINSNRPDLSLPGETEKASNALFNLIAVAETSISPAHFKAIITYSLNKLQIKRVFRLYPNCPAIACDLYYKGVSANNWLQPGINIADMMNIERPSVATVLSSTPIIEKIELPGKHWQIKAVEFSDITDRFNTLVKTETALSYRPNFYRGNILFAVDNTSDNGIFILKEAPTSNVQLAYPGSDFITEYGSFRITGAGISATDLDSNEWKRGYGFVTGVYKGVEQNSIVALRNYQDKIRLRKSGRDEMILMNTWGDRGQDTKINENFALKELEAGRKLGITHFQLDDGWQTGRSANSALKGGTLEGIWNNKNYWEPNPEKFPNGLYNVIQKGKDLGIEICLWFNPSKDSSNKHWEKDANALIGLYKKYGILTFKIDGVNLPDKTSELNFRKFLDKVSDATNNKVVFNLDVTAGRRGGYFYFNEYGNLFLENRYTDWQNYYPYTTLRNLWMLSKYMPSQNLQIEFLNKWRNADKYKDDPFAPSNYSFDYLFALTMMAQPLAWFEGTGLPKEAFAVGSPIIKKYKTLQSDLHKSQVFPIGEEPSGKSFTGFQAVQNNGGYFLIIREDSEANEYLIKTSLIPGTKINCTPLLGNGKPFSCKVGVNGVVCFELMDKKSYALYKYIIK